ncbi:hypothetical protein BH10ACT3_BH10ACT3_17200 [soil metagenome]
MAGSHNQIEIEASPEDVFEILADPRTYPEWLVGAQVIRAVDDSWPEPGSQFHHKIGLGPLNVPGSTTVRALDAPRSLELAAGMGPFGEASVRFIVTKTATGSSVEVEELPRKGLARGAWRVMSPVTNLALWGRNAVSLSKLQEVIERGLQPTDAD